MKLFTLVFAVLLSQAALTQNYHPENINPRAVRIYNQAIEKLGNDEVNEAIPLLEKAIQTDKNYIDAFLSLAGVYGQLKNYNKAVQLYEEAQAKDSAYFRVYKLPYSINLAGLGRFTEALAAINDFLSIDGLSERSIKSANYRKHCYAFAVAYAAKHPNNGYVFTPVNLGDSVNTEKSEYYPSLTIDDSLLVFTRRGEGITENFIQSKLLKDGFSKATLVDGDINNYPSKGAITVSADGDWMIFAGNFENGYGSFDLYISYWTPQGWSEPQNLGENINSPSWDSSPSLSPDNRVLYFSSSRPGGYGGQDLYMSIRQPNGKWGKAVNMGPVINTIGDEGAPYIHADNQTLYFTSSGLPGYGGTDLYLSKKDSLGNWGIPENLGYPVNTIENEGSLAVSANGLTAYFASDRSDSRGGLDLYKFDLREDIRPHKTLYVKGRVYDSKTNKGLPCAIELVDNSNRQPLMRISADELGKYFVPLPSGKDYTFTVNRRGYLLYSDVYSLSSKQADSTYQKDIALQPLEVNAGFTFKNVQFATNSSALEPVSEIELNKLVQILTENPTLTIQINGHTDNTGIEANNITLSNERAKSVANYLVSKGIAKTRLAYKGFGASKPVADNNTPEGRALNRRTECIITGL
ncbi:MAG: PD40 domain-containing protein [Bacteroidota bacterium]|nr:PD40 domain-containing protein [Bacteroidota bacterium]